MHTFKIKFTHRSIVTGIVTLLVITAMYMGYVFAKVNQELSNTKSDRHEFRAGNAPILNNDAEQTENSALALLEEHRKKLKKYGRSTNDTELDNCELPVPSEIDR